MNLNKAFTPQYTSEFVPIDNNFSYLSRLSSNPQAQLNS